MDLILQLIDFVLHVDKHLQSLAAEYGTWIYGILFLIIFCETGLVVTPFLPGDSLLFAAGALCAADVEQKGMSIVVLIPLLVTAAFVGDQLNYLVGHLVGPKFLAKEKLPFIKRAHVERTQKFYATYGGKTVILARFVPIVRTFAPFIAGIGSMRYPRFASFSIIGGIAWVSICSLAGYFFGQIPLVKKNFELVVIGIILVSVLPIVVELIRARAERAGSDSPTP